MSPLSLPPALAKRAGEGTLTHAWLLTGAPERALEAGARALAAAFLCEGMGEKPCGTCKHCRKVEKDIHPDVQWWEKPDDKRQFLVDQVRALRADAYIRPNEAARKVYILKDAQLMNSEAQNAFLKVLEEGPGYAVFLLLAGNHLALLPTVRSRCELLRLDVAAAGVAGSEDAELERKAGELAGLLLGDQPWRLIEWCVPYEKAKREEVVALWQATRQALLTYRTAATTPRAAKLAQTLGELIAAGEQNGNVGVLWGKLWATAQG